MPRPGRPGFSRRELSDLLAQHWPNVFQWHGEESLANGAKALKDFGLMPGIVSFLPFDQSIVPARG